MECLSVKFTRLAVDLLDASVMVVATIALHGEVIIDSIEHRADVHLYQVTRRNREGLVEEIARAVRGYFTTALCGGAKVSRSA